MEYAAAPHADHALAEIARDSSSSPTEIPPDVLANTLLCLTPGYLLSLTVRGVDDVKAIPDALRALFPTDGRSDRSRKTRQ